MNNKVTEIMELADRVRRAQPEEALYFRISAAARKTKVHKTKIWLAAAFLALLAGVNVILLLQYKKAQNTANELDSKSDYFYYLKNHNHETGELL